MNLSGYVAHDCVHGTGPAYFKDVCTPVIDIAGRWNIRSAQRGDMFVPRTRAEFGRRSFHVAAPAPTHLRSTTISRGQFRAGLKTYLFNLAFYTNSLWELLLKSVLTYLLTYTWECIFCWMFTIACCVVHTQLCIRPILIFKLPRDHIYRGLTIIIIIQNL